MTAQSDRPLAIIAGGGSVPAYVAEVARRAGRKTLVLGIEGEADSHRGDAFPDEWIGWGQIGRLEKLLAGHGIRDVVLVGGIRSRPDFKSLKLDFGAVKALPKILSIVKKGDNKVLTGVIGFIEEWGYTVVGAHDVAPELVSTVGVIIGAPSADDLEDIETAFEGARNVGLMDAGQAAVAIGGRVVAFEGIEGTDAMLARVAELRASGKFGPGRNGVLAKCAKPQQDLRVDMPTIGPDTVTKAAAAGLTGIAIEAGRVMIVDRAETIRRATEAGIFISATEPSSKAP